MRENSWIGLKSGPVWRAQSVRNPAGAFFPRSREHGERQKAAVGQVGADVDSPDAHMRGHDRRPPAGSGWDSAQTPCSAAARTL